MTLQELLSENVGALAEDIFRFKKNYTRMWMETKSCFPCLKKAYSIDEQKEIETSVFKFIDEVLLSIGSYPKEKERQTEWLESSVQDWKARAKDLLNISPISINPVFEKGFIRTTREFVENLKAFDPDLKIENVYQALRNVWIMNSLQIYLNLPIEYSDAIFAYSLIYPYTDNYLDDSLLSIEKKMQMMYKLRGWLEGKGDPPDEKREAKIQRLVRKIEAQYDRNKYPQVYQSLLAIFNGQIRSLFQQRRPIHHHEAKIVDISLDKGGTSVLADGYLVNGGLSLEQADFCFGFGLFLQLADDIQDIEEDRKNNHMTLFSSPPRKQKLDDLANKLFFFVGNILELKLEETCEERKKLKKLIHDSCFFLIMEAVGKNKSSFSSHYVTLMEKYFPIRFAFLKKMRRKLKDRFLGENKTVADLDIVSTALLSIASRTFL